MCTFIEWFCLKGTTTYIKLNYCVCIHLSKLQLFKFIVTFCMHFHFNFLYCAFCNLEYYWNHYIYWPITRYIGSSFSFSSLLAGIFEPYIPFIDWWSDTAYSVMDISYLKGLCCIACKISNFSLRWMNERYLQLMLASLWQHFHLCSYPFVNLNLFLLSICQWWHAIV